MKLHRFIGSFDLIGETIEIKNAEIIAQIKNVLRLKPGDAVSLCDGKGTSATGTILAISPAQLNLRLGAVSKNTNEPLFPVQVYCSLLKRENFELACQKMTEAGATAITPLVTERTVKQGFKYDRVQKIIHEAAEQSGRGIVPKLGDLQAFSAVIGNEDKQKGDTLRVLFHGSGGENVSEILHVSSRTMPRHLFIGPEGGWSPTEIEVAKSAGVHIATLGTRTLRAETAAIVATYLCAL